VKELSPGCLRFLGRKERFLLTSALSDHGEPVKVSVREISHEKGRGNLTDRCKCWGKKQQEVEVPGRQAEEERRGVDREGGGERRREGERGGQVKATIEATREVVRRPDELRWSRGGWA
jgi:hypothetical protein